MSFGLDFPHGEVMEGSELSVTIFVIILLLTLNGVLAASEIAMVTAKRAKLQKLAESGSMNAQAVIELLKAPSNFLSTVQIGITLIAIFLGAFGEATLSSHVQLQLNRVSWLTPYSHIMSPILVVLIIGYFSLLAELVPKRLAMEYPERIASYTAKPMFFLSKLASPVVRVLAWSTDGTLKLFGVGGSNPEPPITADELLTLIEMGAKAGTFGKSEQVMMERILALGRRRVSSIMTARPDIVWIDIDAPREKTIRTMTNSPHSYFPVVKGSLDNVLGILHVKDLLSRSLLGETFNLGSALKQPLFLPKGTEAIKVLEKFKETGVHIGLVVDEYGTMQGLVTLTDVLEAIVGNLESSNEKFGHQVVIREDGAWLLDGMLPIEEFKTLFDIDKLPGEERGNYQTLAGFVMAQLGRIPKEGDKFIWQSLSLEVTDMDFNRIDKVVVASLEKQISALDVS